MKAKLVKYPFNDGKRYRWDTYKMGKKFQYSWDESEEPNYKKLVPFLKASNNDYSNDADTVAINIQDNVMTPFEYSMTNPVITGGKTFAPIISEATVDKDWDVTFTSPNYWFTTPSTYTVNTEELNIVSGGQQQIYYKITEDERKGYTIKELPGQFRTLSPAYEMADGHLVPIHYCTDEFIAITDALRDAWQMWFSDNPSYYDPIKGRTINYTYEPDVSPSSVDSYYSREYAQPETSYYNPDRPRP